MSRKRFGRELWERLCESVAVDDGLLTGDFGGIWTAKKLFFLCNYLEQTTRGMAGNPAFPGGLTYLDPFCGTGVCVPPSQEGRSKRFPGSPLIAAGVPKPFSRLLLCDASHDSLETTVTRIKRGGFAGSVRGWNSDINLVASEVAEAIPDRSLAIAFIDPYSLDIAFDTVKRLADNRAMDLIILFSDAIDIVRNVEEYYRPGKSDKLDRFLGDGSNWQRHWDQLKNRSAGNVRQLFADLYIAQLKTLGYTHCKSWPLEGPKGPVYRLVYASKNELGLKYCEIALAEDYDTGLGLFGRL